MNRVTKCTIFVNGAVLTLAILLPMAATASLIPQNSYSYSYTNSTPAGQPGFSPYDDLAMGKLNDSDTGTTNVSDGTWVGWENPTTADQITFLFESSETITNVALNFLRADDGQVELPESVTIGSTTFPTTNLATNNTEGYVSYAGSFTGSSLVVTLNHGATNWVFVNEAQFTGGATSGVPEPTSLTLAGIALSGLIFARKRFHRRIAA